MTNWVSKCITESDYDLRWNLRSVSCYDVV